MDGCKCNDPLGKGIFEIADLLESVILCPSAISYVPVHSFIFGVTVVEAFFNTIECRDKREQVVRADAFENAGCEAIGNGV